VPVGDEVTTDPVRSANIGRGLIAELTEAHVRGLDAGHCEVIAARLACGGAREGGQFLGYSESQMRRRWDLVGDDDYNTIQDDGCDNLGSWSAPIYIVTLNASLDFDSAAETHIALHEIAHGLGLNDAYFNGVHVSCWSSDWLVYPLMQKSWPESNCNDGENPWRYYASGSYTLLNYWASSNEKQKVKDVNNW
jgi:hypothetical protein